MIDWSKMLRTVLTHMPATLVAEVVVRIAEKVPDAPVGEVASGAA